MSTVKPATAANTAAVTPTIISIAPAPLTAPDAKGPMVDNILAAAANATSSTERDVAVSKDASIFNLANIPTTVATAANTNVIVPTAAKVFTLTVLVVLIILIDAENESISVERAVALVKDACI